MADIQVTPENADELIKGAEAAVGITAEAPKGKTEVETKVVDATKEAKPAEGEEAKKGLDIKAEEKPAAEKQLEDAVGGINLDSFYAEYAENGALGEESTKTIVDALGKNFANPEALLAQYMAGASSQADGMKRTAFDIAGGEQEYTNLTAWALENVAPAEIEAYNRAVADPSMVGIAVRGLQAQFVAAGGKVSAAAPQAETGPRVATGAVAQVGHAVLNSDEQVAELVSDPRYLKDPGYRKTADARIQASMDAGHI